jgi:hypothetical protein
MKLRCPSSVLSTENDAVRVALQRSPSKLTRKADLNPRDYYFLWGSLKENIFPIKPQTIMELRALIIEACNEITEDMCRRVINITARVEEVARRNGDHIERLFHRG